MTMTSSSTRSYTAVLMFRDFGIETTCIYSTVCSNIYSHRPRGSTLSVHVCCLQSVNSCLMRLW